MAPQPPQPAPIKKRKKWPWIVGGLALLVFVFGAAGSQDGGSSTAQSNTAAAGSAGDAKPAGPEPTEKDAPKVARLSFGETHTWSGGEAITVSTPEEYTTSNRFMSAPEGTRYVSFDVTVTNTGDDEYNVMATKLTVQHNGQVAQRNYMAGDTLPDVQLPPGGSTTFTSVYEISDKTGKLQVSVEPNVFASNTVYFTGQF